MTQARALALVTGASSGIGAELSVELARTGHDLILTGRDAGRLSEVAARVRSAGAAVETKVLDLEDGSSVEALVGVVGSRHLAVLVNNAGFGISGPFAEAEPARLAAMVTLNITALTLLTRAFLPGMIKLGSGRILNVASTAAFSPCPGMAGYGATKAYVLNFSEAIAEELAGTGVTVTALCPGATDTRFAERASMGASHLFKRTSSAAEVARTAVKALLGGRRVRVAGWQNAVMTFSIRLSPRSLVAKISASMLRKA
ncbi:MAG: SDR family NAD(P)-dependent oxidoreductase [Rectinemataceae bacterium]